jgi:acyl-homoserine-lactone acylase
MRRIPLVAVVAMLVASFAPAASAEPTHSANSSVSARAVASPARDKSKKRHYKVTVTRTTGGIPHITGANFGDVGYGYGFSFAQDNLCVMANDYVTVEGQRSRYFGPTASYQQRGNGVTVDNLDSDIFWTEVRNSGIVSRLASQRPPLGPTADLRAGVAGYVAGYNAYLRRIGGTNGVKDKACHGKPWVRPITVNEAYLRFYQLVLLASSDVLIPGIAEATAPSATNPVSATFNAKKAGTLIAEKWQRANGDLGSNAVAVGSAGARDHKHGVLLGNPHFPWIGTERFYDAQIHVPGKVNVTGASLFGVPLVLIGHNQWIAWSHTVSTAFRFTPYELTLVPGHPTEYMYDGKPTAMQARPVTVTETVDGQQVTIQHTVWWTRYGPMINQIEGIPLPWTAATGFTFRDANATNFRIFNHFLATDEAHSAKQELKILKKYEGIPWVNTIVADKTGHALYADIGTIPNVPNSLVSECDTAVGQVTYKLLGLPVLNGNTSKCNWRTDKGAAAPGIFGAQHLPHLFRRDYVTNSNDSYWLSNPHHPLTGFARIIGTEGTPRSLRTRIGLIMTQDRVSGIGEKKGFTLRAMQDMVFSNRQYAGEMMRAPLVKLCKTFEGAGVIPSTSGVVKVGDACTVLAKWDLHENAHSKGAILFRRFFDNLSGSGVVATVSAYANLTPYFKTSFNKSDPVNTPSGLSTADPQVALALGDAISDLRKAHLPLGVAVDKVQGIHKNGTFIPIQGGEGDPNGEFDAIYAPWIAGKGLGDVDDGSSFVQAVTWKTGDHCPLARTILTYSESTDPTNPHYADQTRMFSKKQWIHDRFCQAAINADPHKQVRHLAGV